MSDQPKRFFDVWFVQANSVIKETPFHVVTDWIQAGRAVPDDQIKPSGTSEWYPLSSVLAFQPYFPRPSGRPEDAYEAMAPVEMDFDWKGKSEEEDEDVDMIPLIDISLVLLIFFMMTMTVASISRIQVPDTRYAQTLESGSDVLRVDIDLREGRRVYALGLGNANPAPEDDNLESDVQLMTRLDETLRELARAPRVRIAAHGDLPFEVVEEVLKGLERRRVRQQIAEYAVEVNERAKP